MPVNSRALLHVQGHNPSLSLSPCWMTRVMGEREVEPERGVIDKSIEGDRKKRGRERKQNNKGE